MNTIHDPVAQPYKGASVVSLVGHLDNVDGTPLAEIAKEIAQRNVFLFLVVAVTIASSAFISSILDVSSLMRSEYVPLAPI